MSNAHYIMKEFDANLNTKEKTELSVQQEQEYQLKLHTTIFSHPNHILWEIDTKTLKVREATFEAQDIEIDLSKEVSVFTPRGKVIIRQGCVYVSALNKKNALKKYRKGENGSRKDPNGDYMEIKLF